MGDNTSFTPLGYSVEFSTSTQRCRRWGPKGAAGICTTCVKVLVIKRGKGQSILKDPDLHLRSK